MSSNFTPSPKTATTSSELESEEISVETTVPTDLTLSPESDVGQGGRRLHNQNGRPTVVTKQIIERKQLLHDLQLIKIELSQKTLIIDNMKAEYMAKTEELEEKLADALHQKHVMQARLESQLQIQQEEMRKRWDQNKLETNLILIKQRELEERNSKLEEKACEIRASLHDLELSDEEFFKLQTQNANQMSLRNFVAVKLYEIKWPLKTELEHANAKMKVANQESKLLQDKSAQLVEELDRERQQVSLLVSRCNKLSTELDLAKSEIRSGDYKLENYDKIKSERDTLLENSLEAKNLLSTLRVENSTMKQAADDLKVELTNLKQKNSLLEQDKDFLSKRFAEVNSRSHEIEDRLEKTVLQLEKATQAREDVYEKYVTAREFYKSQFEKQLKEQLDSIHLKTSSEIEMLRRTAKEMHEQELRGLKDARNLAESQRERAEIAERQSLAKYEKLLDEMRKVQSDGTEQLSSLRSQLTLKTFEAEQTKLLHADSQYSLQQMQLENEKLNKKVELLSSELHEGRTKQERRMTELESEVKDKASKLSVYEKLEQELDDVILQAAEVEDDADGEKLLLSFGREIGVPTVVRRRLQQSFQLAKRILMLEKLNASLKKKSDSQNEHVEELLKEVASCRELLSKVEGPHSNMLREIHSRDDTIKEHKQQVNELQNQLIQLNKDKEDTLKRYGVLERELEKALSNREEVLKMKKLMITLFPNHFSEDDVITPVEAAVRPAPVRRPAATATTATTRTAGGGPKATIFTKTRKVFKPP